MKMLCLKFHQNRPINKEFDFCGAKFYRGAPSGTEGPDLKKSNKPTERWSQPTPKLSAF